LERYKNHPFLVMWSMDNEAGSGRNNIGRMADWVRQRDSIRHIHYVRDHTCRYTYISIDMYLLHDEVDKIGQRVEPALDGSEAGRTPAGDAVRPRRIWPRDGQRSRRVVRISPIILRSTPRCQGGFIWEWIDHGFLRKASDGETYYVYGGDFGEELQDGNFVCDGLMFPNRTPSPGLLRMGGRIKTERGGWRWNQKGEIPGRR
jgi:beta-galactosidase